MTLPNYPEVLLECWKQSFNADFFQHYEDWRSIDGHEPGFEGQTSDSDDK